MHLAYIAILSVRRLTKSAMRDRPWRVMGTMEAGWSRRRG